MGGPGSGNRLWRPTAAERRTITQLAEFGLAEEEIGQVLGHGSDTIAKRCKDELHRGRTMALGKLKKRAFKMAMEGNTSMVIFLLKVRAHWRETEHVVLTGPDGGPLQIAASVLEMKLRRLELGIGADKPQEAPELASGEKA